MVDGIRPTLDVSGWDDALSMLKGPLRESLARSMAVAGGEVFRDEAKRQVPVDEGVLQSSIYLAYREKFSTKTRVQYSVSWNHRRAPHGHLIEFGHWRVNELVPIGAGGMWVATKERLPAPVWVPAQPFIRPAFDIGFNAAKVAMIRRGRERLPELLRGAGIAEGEATE